MTTIEQHINQVKDPATRQAVQKLFEAMVSEFKSLTAKLDADTGVADTDYNASINIKSTNV